MVRGSVAWIAVAPVKGLRLSLRDEVRLERTGVPGDRRFYFVDESGRFVNGKRFGCLFEVVAKHDDNRLALEFPDGRSVEEEVRLGEAIETDFYGRRVSARLVWGPWSEAVSDFAGRPLRLARTDEPGAAIDRSARAAATLVSTAALARLAEAADIEQPVDGRRFRMLFGVDGIPAHAEDGWLGRRVRVGEAVVVPRGNVGRCAVTTLDPDRGVRTLDTLAALACYRGGVETTEPLPFGVWAEINEPGHVRLGDAVEPELDA